MKKKSISSSQTPCFEDKTVFLPVLSSKKGLYESGSYVFCTPDNSSGKIDNTPFGKSSDLCIS